MAYTGHDKTSYTVRLKNLKEVDGLEDPDVYRRIILKRIFKKQDEKASTAVIWLRTRRSGGFCEHGNESSVFINCWYFLETLKDC